MVRSFTSKPLRAFWEKSDASKIAPKLVSRIERCLDAPDQAIAPEELNVPGFDFHSLKGDRKDTYSVHVNGPWCITFRWDGQDAIDVNLENYHQETPVRDPDRQPTHPGAILREDTLPALGLTVAAAAEQLRVSRQALHRVLSEKAALSPEMAVRIGKLCGTGPRLWLAMQQARDVWQAERAIAGDLDAIPTLSAA